MMTVIGDVTGPALKCQYAAKRSYDMTFPGNLSSNTLVLKVWQYAGASLAIDRDAVASPTYSAGTGTTSARFTLTAADATISWSRGFYSIHDETADVILLTGPFIVEQVPYS